MSIKIGSEVKYLNRTFTVIAITKDGVQLQDGTTVITISHKVLENEVHANS